MHDHRDKVGQTLPELPRTVRTLDGPPVRLADLRGRVVLLHFWTFACSNCKRMTPRFGDWEKRLGPKGLTTIGVHTPETSEERDLERLREYVRKNDIRWRVVIDPDYDAWDIYRVQAWPTMMLLDRKGRLAAAFVGDNRSADIERALIDLLGS
jgi:thiol-disulfide isomerase/thioredoxin